MRTIRIFNLNEEFTQIIRTYEKWLITEKCKERTITGFTNQISRFLEWLQNEMKVNTIKKVDAEVIAEYELHIMNRAPKGKGVKIAGLYSRLVEIRKFGKFLKARGYLRYNPASEVKLPKRPRTKKNLHDIPTVEIVNELQGHIDISKNLGQRDYLIIQILAKLGLRNHEVCKLKWHNIMLDDEKVFIGGKGGSEEYLPLDRKLTEALKYYQNEIHPLLYGRKRSSPKSKRQVDTRLVFPSKTGLQMTENSLRDLLTRLSKKSGVTKNVTPKDLRDFFINTLINRGVPIRDVSALARHRDIQTTYQWYIANKGIEKLREVLERHNPFFDIESDGQYNV